MERSMCGTQKMRACLALMVLAVILVGCSLDGGTGSGNGGDQAASCGPQSLDFQSGQSYQLNGSPVQLGGKTRLATPYGSLTIADGCKVNNVGGGGVDVVYVRLYCDGTQLTNYFGIPVSYLKVP